MTGTLVVFDINPTTAWQTPPALDATDKTVAGGSGVENFDNVIINDLAGADLCTEKWVLSATAIACVEITANIARPFKTKDAFNLPS